MKKHKPVELDDVQRFFDQLDATFEGIDWGGGKKVHLKLGREHADDMRGRGGNDLLISLGGDDKVRGDQGNDILLTGAGNDLADGGKGNDVIALGAGNDTAWGGHGNDLIAGGDGDDLIWGGRGRDVLVGGPGQDVYLVQDGDWRGPGDTDLLLSPVDDLLVFNLDAEIEAIRFTASAFAGSAANEITGAILTYAAIFENGDMVSEADADVLWEGTATDFEGIVSTGGLATPSIDVTALAGVLGRVPSDDLDLVGTLFVAVVTEDGKTHRYATDFRGDEGDFAFQFNSRNGQSVADIVWDDTGFALSSATQVVADDLIPV